MKSEDLQSELEERDAQLVRLSHSLEKLKAELSQKDELMKQKDAELTRRSKEIQKLGEKIQRVDSLMAELLDAQEEKRQLEMQVREKDSELCQTRRQLKIAEGEKKEATAAERKMHERCENLKEQVRIEVERAAALEERLHDLEKAAAAGARLQAEADRLTASARDADFLVASARRVQRQLADQLAAVRAELEQLRAAQSSALTAAEAREAAQRQQLAEAQASDDRHRQVAAGMRSLLAELRREFPETGVWIDAYFAGGSCGGPVVGGSGGGLQVRRRQSGRLLNGRPSSSAPHVRRPPSVSDASLTDRSGDVVEVTNGLGALEAADGSATVSRLETERSDASTSKVPTEVTAEIRGEGLTTNGGDSSHVASATRIRVGGGNASRQLRARVAGLYIHLGDRVTVRLGAGAELTTAEAVIKYIGEPAGRQGGGTRYGVKLLDKTAPAVSVALATMAGADAATTMDSRCDLLVRSRQIDSVYNRKTNSFRKLDSLVKEYLEMGHSP